MSAQLQKQKAQAIKLQRLFKQMQLVLESDAEEFPIGRKVDF